MSSAKFASITSSLLARKGEAQPWRQDSTRQEPLAEPPMFRTDMRSEVRAEPVAMVSTPPPSLPAKDKSCAVRMSAHDYERLGILAVKSNSSRQQLLKDALAAFLETRGRQLSCACLGACEKGCG